MPHIKTYIILASVLATITLPSQAAILIDEPFDTDLAGWTNETPTFTYNGTGLSYSGYASTGGAASDATTSQGAPLTLLLTGGNAVTLAEDTTYWGGFLMRVDRASSFDRTFGFLDGAPNNLSNPTNVTLGFDFTNDSSPATINPYLNGSEIGSQHTLTLDETTLVLFRATTGVGAGSDVVDVWINPDLAASSGSSIVGADASWIGSTATLRGANNFDRFIFNSSVGGKTTFDELRLTNSYSELVTAVPEPSTMLFLFSGVLFLLSLRRLRTH